MKRHYDILINLKIILCMQLSTFTNLAIYVKFPYRNNKIYDHEEFPEFHF